MTLSYSVGLTTGSAIAYLLNSWLGPYSTIDPCQQLNSTSAATVVPWSHHPCCLAIMIFRPVISGMKELRTCIGLLLVRLGGARWQNVHVDRGRCCRLSATVLTKIQDRIWNGDVRSTETFPQTGRNAHRETQASKVGGGGVEGTETIKTPLRMYLPPQPNRESGGYGVSSASLSPSGAPTENEFV